MSDREYKASSTLSVSSAAPAARTSIERGATKQEEAPQERQVVPFTALQEAGFATMRRNAAKRRKRA